MAGLFGKKVSTFAPVVASLQLQTSCWGRPIPYAYGQTRLAGNLVWYGDYTPIAHTEEQGGKGGGGQSSTTYTYTAAVVLGLAQGAISAIPQVWANKKKASLASLNLTMTKGLDAPAPPSWLTSKHPTEALGYARLATVSSPAYDLGSTASLPTHSFEIQGTLYNTTGVTGVPDAAIPLVINDLLFDPLRGAGFTDGLIGSLTAMTTYCRALGLWVSPAYIDSARVGDMIDSLLKIANTAAYFSEGMLKFKPYADANVNGNGVTYNADLTVQYALTDDDFVAPKGEDPIEIKRTPNADAFNCFQVQFKDRTQEYATNIAEAKDDAAIALFGLRIAPLTTFDEINDPVCARMVAQLLLNRSIMLRNTYKFTTNLRYMLLEPMDLVELTESTGDGLQQQVVRLLSVQENDDDTLTFTAEDFIGTVHSSPVYDYQQAFGYSVDYNQIPAPIGVPYIFDAPGRLATNGYEVWVAVASPDPIWGGAFAWISTDGNTYKLADRIRGPSRYGVLAADLDAGADPDTTDTISVDLSESGGVLSGGTQNDADVNNTLSILDGELISYSTATLTGPSAYDFTDYVRRGVYGTDISDHLAGASFARIDNTALLKIPYDPLLIGSTLYFKFTSFNVWEGGEEDISTVPVYTYLIGGPIGAPADVTGLTATIGLSTIHLSWNAVPIENHMQYEVRTGDDWDSAEYVGTTLSTFMEVDPVSAGSTTWLVKALDRQGKYSINPDSFTLTIGLPSAPDLTVQVIDNNVLLSWTASVSAQPILTYEIREGGTSWDTATMIGTKTGLFTSVFEQVAGNFTYWVAAIDIAGNIGPADSVTAYVSSPPDYVLKNNFISTLNGTVSNAKLDQKKIVLPIDTTTTFQTHFTAQSWASPQDQVDAGFERFIEKSLSSGYYEEVFDTGSVLAAAKITAAINVSTVDGAPTAQMDISTSPDNVTYTAFTNVSSVYGTSFRWIKVRYTVSSSGGDDLQTINGLQVRVELKLKSDFGSLACLAADSGGTTATFNNAFLNVVAINATPQGSGVVAFAVVNFAGGANPTTFKIQLYNASGTRVNGTAHWEARGY